MAAGTYNSSRITADKPPPGVTMVLAGSGTVTLADGFDCDGCSGIAIVGDRSNVARLNMPTFYSTGGSRVTLRYATLAWDGLTANSGITDASDQITIDGSDLSAVNCGNLHINTHIQAPSTNIRITNNLFHDFTANAGCHSEAIWMAAVDGGELSGNRFKRIHGNTADVFFTTTDGEHCYGVSNVTVEGNWFGAPSSGSGFGMQFAEDPGCHNTQHHITFHGNCWEGNAMWLTMAESQTASPGTAVTGEYGRLGSSNRAAALSLGVTFDRYPYLALARCPLDSSG